MNRTHAPTSSRSRFLLALGFGFLLGQAVAAMPQRGEGAWLSFVISIVLIASASASFVLFTLSQQRAPAQAALRSRQAHGLVGLIACGLLLSLRLPELLA
ncbi:MAG: hypothetical protein H7Y33_16590 [Cytophagales bacterium]|nr:hypothetical protein [Rhizobacter sp.]